MTHQSELVSPNGSVITKGLVDQVSLLGLLPADNIPDSLKVVSLHILVLQVVGVLPSINGHQWHQWAGDSILVGSGNHLQCAILLVLDNEGPSRSLDSSQLAVGNSLQVVERAKLLVDLLGKFGIGRRRLASTLLLRSQVLPEQAVVGVSSTVEVDELLQLDGLLDITLDLGLGGLFNCLVVTGDIGLVVLRVVDLVDLGRDIWLQSVEVPVQVWQRHLGSDGTDGGKSGAGGTGCSQSRRKHGNWDCSSGKQTSYVNLSVIIVGTGQNRALLLARGLGYGNGGRMEELGELRYLGGFVVTGYLKQCSFIFSFLTWTNAALVEAVGVGHPYI